MAKPSVEAIRRRFGKHELRPDQVQRCEGIRQAVTEAAIVIVANSRGCAEQSRALNKLDEALTLAFYAIARGEQ